ncbi:MAG: YbfB/YjiJ family MFS transporter, partial [Actinobacteria bacterium]|nr:YbfB/YjiJ family MFS transporter [Actinomycetota bacterium]
RTLALMTASFALGQMVGPTFAGFTFDLGDSFLVPSLAAATALIGSAWLVMVKHQPQALSSTSVP